MRGDQTHRQEERDASHAQSRFTSRHLTPIFPVRPETRSRTGAGVMDCRHGHCGRAAVRASCKLRRLRRIRRLPRNAAGCGAIVGQDLHTSEPSSATDRLDSWKDIAAYLHRDVSTVQRWEKREGMPVHRHVHEKLGTVYAFRSEIDVWSRGRGVQLTQLEGPEPEPALVP